MSQTLLFLALHCVGASVCLAIGPRRQFHLCCALGMTIGLALMVPVVLLLCTTGIPYTPVTAGTIAVVAIALSWWRITRRAPATRAELRAFALWAIGFTLVCLPLTHINMSFLTFDSHTIVMLGGAIADDAGFEPGMIEQLSDWGVFQVVAQSGVGMTKQSYLYSLPLVLGLSTAPVFALATWRGLDVLGARPGRGKLVLTCLITAVTFTSYMFVRHFFYIHTNLGSAVYLFEFAALWWLAEAEGDTDYLPPAFIAMLALALHRIEHPIVCAMFLTMTVLVTKLPIRKVLVALGVYTAAIVVWFVVLAQRVSPESEFLTPNKCYFSAGVVGVFYLYAHFSLATRIPLVEKFNRWLPAITAVLFAVGLVFAFQTKYEHMMISLEPWWHNMIKSESWAGVWPLIFALAIIGLFAPAPPARTLFVWGIPLYFVLILLIVYGRSPYRIGTGDSGIRMALHLIPITFFYFGIKFFPLMLEPEKT